MSKRKEHVEHGIIPYIGFLNIMSEECAGERIAILSRSMSSLVDFGSRIIPVILDMGGVADRVFISRTHKPSGDYFMELDVCVPLSGDGALLNKLNKMISAEVERWVERGDLLDYSIVTPYKRRFLYNPYLKGLAIKWGEKGVILPEHEMEGMILELISEYGVEIASTLLEKLGEKIGEKKMQVLSTIEKEWSPPIAVQTLLIMLHTEGWITLKHFDTRSGKDEERVIAFAIGSLEEEVLLKEGINACSSLTKGIFKGFLNRMAETKNLPKEKMSVEEKKCLYRDGSIVYELKVPRPVR